MAVVGGGLGVVQDGLVRDVDIKNVLKNERGFSGADGEGDVEGQDEAKDVLRVVDPPDIDEWFEWAGVNEVCSLE